MWRALDVARRVLASAALVPSTAQAGAPADAEAIFAHVLDVARADAHPRYAQYDVVVSYGSGERRVVDTWQTTEDVTHATVMADAFSSEERSAPGAPHGTNIVAHRRFAVTTPRSFDPSDPDPNPGVNSRPLNGERRDPIGPVAFAVDQNFGLTPPHPYAVAHDAGTMATRGAELATIGSTGATTMRYRVALLDRDGDVAHLGLTPLRDPYHNRLRELWVDSGVGYVRAAIVAGVGDRAPFDRTRWRIDFERRDGGTYVAREEALEPIDLGGIEHLQIAFERLKLLSTSPFTLTFGISTPVRALRDP